MPAQGNALGLVLRDFDLAPKGPDKPAQGNALGGERRFRKPQP
jgi:hypothetical protein